MNWGETIAGQCRYGDVAEKAFGLMNILWEDSTDDYQGGAEVLAKSESRAWGEEDKPYVHYEWSYGSCSGCDGWEDQGLSDAKILAEMMDGCSFYDKESLGEWLNMLKRESGRQGLIEAIEKELSQTKD